MIPVGTLVDGRYTIVRLVAEGGMSIVYEVSDNRLPGRLVLKQMREIAADPEAQRQVSEQFDREAATLAQLSHPNLPRVTDHFHWSGMRFLVEELVEGRTLEEVLDECSPREEVEVVPWAVQICESLAYLHGKGIVYRDLKPSNVMLTPDGGIRLIDFGIVRSFTVGKSRDTVVMGTPGFAAPEQYGLQQTDPRSDVFSLGALLHHLLTGHDPALTPFVFPPARRLNPLVSERTEAIVARALSVDADQRFATADALRLAISGHEPVRPEGETFRYPEQASERRWHALSAALCVAGGVASAWTLPETPGSSATALLFLPFWLWQLWRSYRGRLRRASTSITVDDAGVRWTEAGRSVQAAWSEITGAEVRENTVDGTQKLAVRTSHGSLEVQIAPPRILPDMLDAPAIGDADRLTALLRPRT